MSLRSTPSQKSVVAPMEIQKIPSFDASTCPIVNVVVYPDKAEVTRRINAQVQEGLSQIKMTNLSKCVDPTTIRVLINGGNAILNEVDFSTRSVFDECADASGKLDELKAKQTHLIKELNDIEVKENTLRKQSEVLEAFANRIVTFKANPQDNFDVMSMSSLDMVAKFLPMYEEQSSKICQGLNEVKEHHLAVEKQMKEVAEEINSTDPTKDGIVSREVSILIESYEEVEVKLFVSYVVSDAGWLPKYDLRVHFRDQNLKVLYFGLVSQNTGEDWVDAKISLSTATPSTGGIPALGTHELYSRPVNIPGTPGQMKRSRQGTSVRRKKSDKSVRAATTESANVEDDTNTEPGGLRINGIEGSDENLVVDFKEINLEETTPLDSRPLVISTTYGAASEECSVPSGEPGTKVHIAKIDLPAAFFYTSCPRVCPHAFLRITARNDSAYALLAGQADVFLDGNFCNKASIKDVCPTEDFELDVGSDPTIKVAYRPLLRHKETGSKTHLISYTQDMDLKNIRADPVNILVVDQLPKSNDDKVKVILHEPDVKKKKDAVAKLNSNNNIEWNVEIPADSTAKIKLRYSVEYPIHMDISGLI